jgi:hypothetical protein
MSQQETGGFNINQFWRRGQTPNNVATTQPQPQAQQYQPPQRDPVPPTTKFKPIYLWGIVLLLLLFLFFHQQSSYYVDSCIDYFVEKFESFTGAIIPNRK